MTTDVAVTPFVDPDVASAMALYDRLKPLQDALGLNELTVPEMQLFSMVAHHTGLDPFTKQIYAIKRAGKVTHQTGIDGYRSSAERTHEYAGSDETTFEVCGCGAADSPPEHPSVARTVVHRILPNGHVVNQTGVARWHELKPEHKAGRFGFLDDMWWDMPWNQLSKCSEANGLRKAFPRVLGGVYITEEMQQAQTIEGTATVLPSAAERIAERRRAIEQPTAAPEPVAATETAAEAVIEGTAIEVDPALCAKPSPYEADSPSCSEPRGHKGLCRNARRESWTAKP